jgi:lipopolysaccharide transport system ATP-binding protein
MSTVIRVENLGKKYIIRHEERERYLALRDVIAKRAKGLAKRLQNPFSQKVASTPSKEDFWALKDISFEVKQGDRLGIIGRNGAGKSTLLKVLSRITEPTTGRISIKGRVASLLEVGTGFHPELTGRENIYLNGAIMGMSQAEIKRKFDEIVAFAEVEKFLDTPVKRYSSGMYMRLAFSVAAHLEPEILIVDEVLAVGDAQFQKKCLGKMEEVGKEGRTVLFVSHNMGAVQNMCNRALLLEDGSIITDDIAKEVVNRYIKSNTDNSKISLLNRMDRKGNGSIRFTSIEYVDGNGNIVNTLLNGQNIRVRFYYKNYTGKDLKNLRIDIGINNYMNDRISWLSTELTNYWNPTVPVDANFVELNISKLPLTSGRYSFTIFATVNGDIVDWIQNAGCFEVEDGDFYQVGKVIPNGQGYFMLDHIFKIVN